MGEDESFYNALIAALIIGIIIVVITLFVSRPAPEVFTELYINNHLTLPKYVHLGVKYPYSFSINNLQRKDMNYSVNYSVQLFRFDRSCESPRQYLEKVDNSEFEAYLGAMPQKTTTNPQPNMPSVPNQSAFINTSPKVPPPTVDQMFQDENATERNSSGEIVQVAPTATEPPATVNQPAGNPPQSAPTKGQPSSQQATPATSGPGTIPTRRSQTDDPALLIRNDNFSVRFSERSLAGVGQVIATFESLDKRSSATAIINEDLQKAILKVGLKQTVADISIRKGEPHNILLIKQGNNLALRIDQKPIMLMNISPLGPGFISFETTNTYAQINGVVVSSGNTEQRTSISYADYSSDEQYLLDDNHPGLFAAKDKINFTDYSFETHFRFREGTELKMGVNNSFIIFYNQTNLNFNQQYYALPKSNRNVHTLSVEAFHGKASLWIDGVQIINKTDLNVINGTPFLETLGSDVDLRTMAITSLQAPESISYSAPMLEIKLPANPLPLKAFKIGGANADNITEIVSDLFEQEQMDWLNYYLTARYLDNFDNGTLLFSFYGRDTPYYSININNARRNATIGYIVNNTLLNRSFNIEPIGSAEHEFNLDVKGQKVSFIVDNQILLSATLDRATNGVMLLNQSSDLIFENIIIQDKDNPIVKIYEKKAECIPILVGESLRNESLFLYNNQTLRMNDSVDFLDPFDIAKVQVGLNTGQEVHFWVTRT